MRHSQPPEQPLAALSRNKNPVSTTVPTGHSANWLADRIKAPPGVSFGTTQRFPKHRVSHLRQSLNPAMPAPPVGLFPGFRAVAYICVVTSPNEVKLCLHAPPTPWDKSHPPTS